MILWTDRGVIPMWFAISRTVLLGLWEMWLRTNAWLVMKVHDGGEVKGMGLYGDLNCPARPDAGLTTLWQQVSYSHPIGESSLSRTLHHGGAEGYIPPC